MTDRCDYHFDPASRCDGVYDDDDDGRCDQCGRPPLLERERERLEAGRIPRASRTKDSRSQSADH